MKAIGIKKITMKRAIASETKQSRFVEEIATRPSGIRNVDGVE